jgi:type I restriction enzyme, S subunit
MIPDTVFRIGVNADFDPEFTSLIIGSNKVQRDWNRKKVGLAEAQVNINHQIINGTIIPYPPLAEQQKIASIHASLNTNIEEKQKKLNHIQSLKKSLMQDLLTGKVRVSVN